MFRALPVPLQIAAVNLLLALANFATGIVLARALGADGRGVYGSLFLWALTLANICAWGAQINLARRTAQEPHLARAAYRTAYRLSLIGGWAGFLIYLAIVLPTTAGQPHFAPWLVVVAALIIPFAIPNAFQIQIELGRSKFATYNLIRALFTVSNAILTASLWLAGVRDLGPYLVALAATALFGSLAGWWVIRPSLPPRDSAAELPLWQTLRESTPVAVSLVFAGIAQQSDKLFASALFEPGQVGIYLVAATLAQTQGMVGEALAQMFFARGAGLRDLADADREWLGMRLRQTIAIYAAVCLVGLAVLPPLVPPIYGHAFASSANLLWILLPGLALQGMSRPFEELLRGLDRARTLMAMAIALILIVGLFAVSARWSGNFLLLPLGVIAGFASALLIGAATVAKGIGAPLLSVLVPRPADIADLAGNLRRRVAGPWR